MKKGTNLPSKTWPIGSTVTMVDAYGFNPVDGKVIRHYPIETNILVEDAKGIVYFGETWRIISAAPRRDLFDDLLGDGPVPASVPAASAFEDLLG